MAEPPPPPTPEASQSHLMTSEQKRAQEHLRKEGYIIAPLVDILDKIVTTHVIPVNAVAAASKTIAGKMREDLAATITLLRYIKDGQEQTRTQRAIEETQTQLVTIRAEVGQELATQTEKVRQIMKQLITQHVEEIDRKWDARFVEAEKQKQEAEAKAKASGAKRARV